MKNRVKIVVDGKSFTLVGEESEEHMRQVAAYVDTKMRELRRDAVSVRLDSSLAYALTSLNIADEYYKEKNRNAELEGRIIGLTARLTELTAQLDAKGETPPTAVAEPILDVAPVAEAVTVLEEEPMIIVQGVVMNGAVAEVLEETPVAVVPQTVATETTEKIAETNETEATEQGEPIKRTPMAMKGNAQGGKQYKNNKKQHYGRR